MQFVREFAKLGLTRSVGGVLALALARELTPVVTSIILAGRVGSAFAAELGTMAVRFRRTLTTRRPLYMCRVPGKRWQ
jgi:ABC-type transporter Mla maintaining outer membrane lipid asymmetry permease subunit MlaE